MSESSRSLPSARTFYDEVGGAPLPRARRALLRRRPHRSGARPAVPAGRLGRRRDAAARLPRAVLGRPTTYSERARPPAPADAARPVRHRPGRAGRWLTHMRDGGRLPGARPRAGRHALGLPGHGGHEHAEPLPRRRRSATSSRRPGSMQSLYRSVDQIVQGLHRPVHPWRSRDRRPTAQGRVLEIWLTGAAAGPCAGCAAVGRWPGGAEATGTPSAAAPGRSTRTWRSRSPSSTGTTSPPWPGRSSRLAAGDTRRNLVTTGVDLPDLVGRWSASATRCCSG